MKKITALLLASMMTFGNMTAFVYAEGEAEGQETETVQEISEEEKDEENQQEEINEQRSEGEQQEEETEAEESIEETDSEPVEETIEEKEGIEETEMSDFIVEEAETEEEKTESSDEVIRGTEGEAYAVLSRSDLIFFRSTETYTNNTSGTFTDIRGNSYNGRVFTEIETLSAKNYNDIRWYSYTNSIRTARVAEGQTIHPISTRYWFYNCSSLTGLDVSSFDTSNVTDMSYMFSYCSSLTSLDVSSFDTSNVTDMSNMFRACSSLTGLDVSSFDTSNVTNMGYMFYNCSSLTSLDVSSFDTSNVTDMQSMFSDCSSLTSLDLSSFDTSNVTYMGSMFSDCSSLTSLDVSSFDTSNVTSMFYMFNGCHKLTSLDVSSFDTSNVTYMLSMFESCWNLTNLDLSSFDTSNVTDMSYMFSYCSSLTSLDVSSFDTSNVTNMYHMFYNCSSLTSLDVSSFDTSNVTDMTYMFYGCSNLSEIKLGKGFTNWFYSAYLPSGSWSNRTLNISLTAEELYSQFPQNAETYAGTWLKNAVMGIVISPKTIGLPINEAQVLGVQISPATATNRNVTWTSSDENVVTVDENGKITAVGGGTATITVTTEDGGYTATCDITVLFPVESVTLSETKIELNVGETKKVNATVKPDASNQNVTWTSSDKSVATVDQNGKIAAVSKGTATITVTTEDGGYTATCEVTVRQKPESVTLNMTNAKIEMGDELYLYATVEPYNTDNKNVIWTSSDNSVATVDENGRVLSVHEGTATITVTTEDGGYTATCEVTVVEKPVATSFETALEIDITQTNELKTEGRDRYYKFVPEKSGNYIFKFENKLNEMDHHYTDARIYDADKKELASSYWPSGEDYCLLNVGMEADKLYYLFIDDRPFEGTVTTKIVNDCFENAYDLHEDMPESVSNRYKELYYRFVPEKSGAYVFESIGNNQSGYTGYYYLYDEEKKLIKHSWSDYSKPFELGFYLEAGETYYFTNRQFTGDFKVSESHQEVLFEYRKIENENAIVITKYIGYEKDVVIPEKLDGMPVRVIGQQAFDSCMYLATVEFPETIEKIEYSAFNNCPKLEELNLPNSLISISYMAFHNCIGLKSVKLPDSIPEVTGFDYCTSLIEIEIPANVTRIGQSAFEGCTGLTDVVLPENVTSISYSAFKDCANLESISGAKVTSIGSEAFSGCTSLKTIDMKEVYGIGSNAFSNCTSLMEFDVSRTSRIESNAFSGCTNLKSVGLIGDIKPLTTGSWYSGNVNEYAFKDCTALEEVHIGNSTTAIGLGAFRYCTNLKTVYFYGTEAEWNQIDIKNYNEPLKNANIVFSGKVMLGLNEKKNLKDILIPSKTGTIRWTSGDTDKVTIDSNGNATGKKSGVVTVTATLNGKKIVESQVIVQFSDVSEPWRQYFYDAVYWAVDNGITQGMGPTIFNPGGFCKRYQFVLFLWRQAGQPEPTLKTDPFTDVLSDPKKDVYEKAVLWAVEKGITTGTTKTTFDPYAPLTRGQVVTFLYRAAGEPQVKNWNNPFKDVDSSKYYYTPVLWAVEKGITTGLNATQFGPTNTCTRGQTVLFMYRLFK